MSGLGLGFLGFRARALTLHVAWHPLHEGWGKPARHGMSLDGSEAEPHDRSSHPLS
jgi:hypothetical protein